MIEAQDVIYPGGKAHMMARLEKAVDELLDWEAQHPRPTLRQLEDIVLELRKQVGEEMADEVLGRMEGRTPVPEPACAKCGKEMRYKGQHEKQVESRAGEIEYERGYYACPECEAGLFPAG